MARQYPRFLYSNSQDTKSKGHFITHNLDPVIICRVFKFDPNRILKNALIHFPDSNFDIELVKPELKKFDADVHKEIIDTIRDMSWWVRSKIQTGEITL